ncbi:MAG: acyl transferase [Chitinophagaceae bacterium]
MPVYQQFCNQLDRTADKVKGLNEIPFLPISFFKSHKIIVYNNTVDTIFESSGTIGMTPSRHYVHKQEVYEQSFRQCFQQFYGAPNQYCILGLLPSYLERGNSSLVYMVKDLIEESNHKLSGFYLHDFDQLHITLKQLEEQNQPTILIGVTYALLDFAEAFPVPLKNTIIMETGGMKGRKKELIRSEVHAILQNAFSLEAIHSEYGMTELLSQAYAKKEGTFFTPKWMKVFIRDEDDPLSMSNRGTGGINIIDLANIYSCSFIATEDVGKLHADKSFEVLGRIDYSDIRGCSLLAL